MQSLPASSPPIRWCRPPYDLQGLNRYGYVFNDPLGYTDPSGYEGEKSLGGITVKDRRWQSALGNTPEPVYTLGGDWSGSGYGVPYSPPEFAKRFDNAPHVGQPSVLVLRPLPTIIVTDRRESDLGKVADMAAALTPFGYSLDYMVRSMEKPSSEGSSSAPGRGCWV